MDLKVRFQRRRAKQAELCQKYGWDCHILHIASGSICPAAVELAATLITDGSHREATPAEVATYQENQKREAERIAAAGRRMARTNQEADEKDPNARRYEFI